jgi:hypothetical protein
MVIPKLLFIDYEGCVEFNDVGVVFPEFVASTIAADDKIPGLTGRATQGTFGIVLSHVLIPLSL